MEKQLFGEPTHSKSPSVAMSDILSKMSSCDVIAIEWCTTSRQLITNTKRAQSYIKVTSCNGLLGYIEYPDGAYTVYAQVFAKIFNALFFENKKLVFVNDLHSIYRLFNMYLSNSKVSLKIPKNLIDATFLFSWNQTNISQASGMPYARYLLELYNSLSDISKKYIKVWNFIIKEYAKNEKNCIFVNGDNDSFIKKYISYEFGRTRTGRLVSSGSNCFNGNFVSVHNVAKDNRHKIVPFGNYNSVIQYDYTAAEILLACVYSGDKFGIDCIKSGVGPYERVMEACDIDNRDLAKSLFLQYIYRASEKSVAFKLNLNETNVLNYFKSIRKCFPTLFEWSDGVVANASRDGYIETPTGRKILLSEEDISRERSVSLMMQSMCSDANVITFARLIKFCNEQENFQQIYPAIHLHDAFILMANSEYFSQYEFAIDSLISEFPYFCTCDGLKMLYKKKISKCWE